MFTGRGWNRRRRILRGQGTRTTGDFGFDINADMSDLTPDFIPDWHFKEPHFPKPCFGFCPEMENWP